MGEKRRKAQELIGDLGFIPPLCALVELPATHKWRRGQGLPAEGLVGGEAGRGIIGTGDIAGRDREGIGPRCAVQRRHPGAQTPDKPLLLPGDRQRFPPGQSR